MSAPTACTAMHKGGKGHRFCASCIHQWNSTNSTCPVCRAEVLFLQDDAAVVVAPRGVCAKLSKAVMLWLVKCRGELLGSAPEWHAHDASIVKAALHQNGRSLRHAAAEFCADKNMVLIAVARNGMALKYAHATLQDDYDVVMAAVTQNGMALMFAKEMRKNRTIVLTALHQTRDAWVFMNEAFFTDVEVMHVYRRNGK